MKEFAGMFSMIETFDLSKGKNYLSNTDMVQCSFKVKQFVTINIVFKIKYFVSFEREILWFMKISIRINH